MNYLAHMFLSSDEEDLMLGNLSGDFVRKAEMTNLKAGIIDGILLHRKIDKYTDTHPVVDESIAKLSPVHGKYAAVIVDILYDHLLTHNWDNYTDEPLDDFKSRVYEILSRRKDDLPKKLRGRIDQMIERDFIEAYKSFEGMRVIMRYMDKRTKYPSNFESSIDLYENQFELFNKDFNSFLPDLLAYVNTESQVVKTKAT